MSAYVATTGSVGSGNPKKSVPKKPVPVPKRSLTKAPQELDEDGNPVTGKRAPRGNLPSMWKPRVTFNLSNTQQPLVREVISDLGFTVAKDADKNAMVIWFNGGPPPEAFSTLQSFQKINHFPGTGEISHKDNLARNLDKLHRVAPKEYNFAPKSWILPSEYSSLRKHCDDSKRKGKQATYIFKPPNSAQGRGIQLTRTLEDIPDDGTMLVQEYLPKPFLIDGYKFDLRLYVLVTSYEPLRVFLYRDGLVRLSTQKYKAPTNANLDKLFMHLTNYSLNKFSKDYDDSEGSDSGSKRTIKWMMEHLAEEGHDTEKIWADMADVIIKTLIVAWPHNVHAYRVAGGQGDTSEMYNPSNCFTILGFDIFLNKNLKPYIIEVNRSPSFSTNGEELDQEIKHGVLTHAIRLLKLRPSQKTKAVSKTRAESQSRLMRGRRSVSTLSTDSDTSSPGRKPRTGSAGTSASGTDPAAPYDDPEKHKRIEADRTEYEDKHRGDYYRIYPTGNTERMTAYKELIGKSTEIFFHAGGTKVSSDWKKESTLLPASPLSSPAMARRRGSKGGGLPNLSSTGSPLANRRAMGGGVRAPGLAIGSGQPPGVGRKISADPLPAVDYEAFLAELDGMRIECPGKTRQQTEGYFAEIKAGWTFHSVRIQDYWMRQLDTINRKKIIDIVRTKVAAVLEELVPGRSDKLRVTALLGRTYERLTWQNGLGLWNFFDVTKSRQQAFSFVVHSSNASPNEHKSCRRVVELAEECLLVVYLSSAYYANVVAAEENRIKREALHEQEQERAQQQQVKVPHRYSQGARGGLQGNPSVMELVVQAKQLPKFPAPGSNA